MPEKELIKDLHETREKIIAIVNEAGLPAFCLKVIMNDILNQIQEIDNQEIEKYKKELENDKKEG